MSDINIFDQYGPTNHSCVLPLGYGTIKLPHNNIKYIENKTQLEDGKKIKIENVKNIKIKKLENGLFEIKFIIENGETDNVTLSNLENIDYDIDNNNVTITNYVEISKKEFVEIDGILYKRHM